MNFISESSMNLIMVLVLIYFKNIELRLDFKFFVNFCDSSIEKLLFRIRSVKKAKRSKYVLMNVPNENLDQIIGLLPGMRSPTVLPLAESGWSSVHSVLSEDEFWDRIEKLRAAGAEGILVVPIEKLIL